MPWRNSNSIPFTRIHIAASVPSESGVYGILDSKCCVFIGDSWNLKARLLDLANVLTDMAGLTIVYELCDDDARSVRKQELTAEFLHPSSEQSLPLPHLPGISFSLAPER
jgi:hypothetical protein